MRAFILFEIQNVICIRSRRLLFRPDVPLLCNLHDMLLFQPSLPTCCNLSHTLLMKPNIPHFAFDLTHTLLVPLFVVVLIGTDIVMQAIFMLVQPLVPAALIRALPLQQEVDRPR